MSEQVEEPKVKMSIFSLDLLDNNGVTVSLFPPIARGITEEETTIIVDHAREIERICFSVIQRSAEFVNPGNVTDINVGSKGKRKKKQS